MISDVLLAEFNRFLSEHTGLYFNKENWPQLVKGLVEAAREFKCETPEKCILWLMSTDLNQKQIEILASYLTVGETYFFREKKSFDVLENIILPELIQERQHEQKRLRIWSAACSTGEEAYSIAIVVDRKKEQLKDFNISIMATDINCKALKTAREGIYGDWSFRNNSQGLKEIYFTRADKNQYKIKPHLHKMVIFEYFNLVKGDCPSLLNGTNGIDIIFCRNVLMYFEPQMAKKVATHLFHCLRRGGWLITSPTDAFNIIDPGILRVDIPEAPVYRKISIAPPHLTGSRFDLSPPPPSANVKITKENISILDDKYYKALEFYWQGSYIKATEILESLLSHPSLSNPEKTSDEVNLETHACELLVRSYANEGKLEQAEKACLKTITSAKLNPQCRYLMAIIQLEQGKIEEAKRSLKQSLYIDPNFIPAHFTLGNIAWQKENYQEANHYFDNCLSLLNNLAPDMKLMEFDEWLTVGRLKEMIKTVKKEAPFYG